MRMFWPGIDLEFSDHFAAEAVLGQHPPDGEFDGVGGVAGKQIAQVALAYAAGITCVTVVHFLVHLAPRNGDTFGVDDDNIVADVEVWAVDGFVLAFENTGDLGSETTQGLAIGVYNKPFTSDFFLTNNVCSHFILILLRAYFYTFVTPCAQAHMRYQDQRPLR
jgi:hypothetical protein